MKKIGRIDFNTDRRITNDELLSLRGGTEPGGGMGCCMCYGGMPIEKKGYLLGTNQWNCDSSCRAIPDYIYGMWECIV